MSWPNPKKFNVQQKINGNGFVVNSGITNASRGTSNAWHFYYALILVVTVLCGNLVVALSAP
ncbi:DUF3265 domain-containing protein [Vibrio metschnikovii]|nr:DUF3265 domain-containing protein [Vibrio metschnikovii]EKO3674674.1 DUF3265 domain-containing protein [Vibrio metschnikovii]